MKTSNALIEIFSEELPPKSLWALASAFAEGIKVRLNEAKLSFDNIKVLASPRRLALIVENLEEKQAPSSEEKRGPSVKAAFDKEGHPTKAAEGFAKSCGVPLDKMERLKTDKGEWIACTVHDAGQSIHALLPAMVMQALQQLPIPKPMRWGNSDFTFIRPVHAVTLLYGRKVIDAEVLGIKTSNVTYGHRFHAPEAIKIRSADTYIAQLLKAKVMVDFPERQTMIKHQLKTIADEKQGEIIFPKGLLDEVTSLVEWPVALCGQFDDPFLALPREVLISVLEQHQKCFALEKDNKLLPFFVTISNIESQAPALVIQGNERVVRARFSDAQFFYEVDRQETLATRVTDLKSVLFQKQLGSLYDKTERMVALAELLSKQIRAEDTCVMRATVLSKTDLLTGMVGEFPELQGVMGCYYARHDKEPDAVAVALREQYLPRFAEDVLPSTSSGQALAIVDRVDTVVGIFAINKAPTGEKDPFGLRRAALGVLRLIIEKRLDLDLFALIKKSAELYQAQVAIDDVKKLIQSVLQFIQGRHKHLSLRAGFSADVFAAVSACDPARLYDFQHRLEAVKVFCALPAASGLAEANKRVSNLLKKQSINLMEQTVDEGLLKESAEKDLFKVIKEHQVSSKGFLNKSDYKGLLAALSTLREPVDQFFSDVLVMTDDKALQTNRLALLANLRQLFLQVADISLLQLP